MYLHISPVKIWLNREQIRTKKRLCLKVSKIPCLSQVQNPPKSEDMKFEKNSLFFPTPTPCHLSTSNIKSSITWKQYIWAYINVLQTDINMYMIYQKKWVSRSFKVTWSRDYRFFRKFHIWALIFLISNQFISHLYKIE